jgi:putative ABC transport system ATP-binding protein
MGRKGRFMIQLNKITKSFRKGKEMDSVLQNLSFAIDKGDYIAIMGRSGSGKSTLMNIIGALDNPTSGEYLFLNQRVHQMGDRKRALFRNKHIGFVFQSFHLIPTLSVYQNILLALTYQSTLQFNKRAKIEQVLEQVGLLHKKNMLPNQLSGGEKQRVAIARAIINEPNLLLADEPTGSLDEETSISIMDLFKELHHKGVTIIMITHDHGVAKHANRIFDLKNGTIKERIHETD